MNRDNHIVDGGRRRMLKTIGVISGAAMAAPMIPGISGKAFAGTAANILSGKRSLGIGLLLPGSTSPSSHAARLRRGLELALAINGARAGGRRIELIAAEVHPSVAATLRAARELASDDRTDVVVGMTSPRVTRMIADVFEEERTLFIETGAGETMTLPAERRPHIFHNSLGLWRSTMALGAWAARNLGRNGGVMASFYDSGHDTLMAFRHGFEEAGGRIVIEQITGTPKRNAVELTLANAARAIADARPDFILGLHSDAPSIAFVDICRRLGIADDIPLLATGIAVDEHLLPRAASSAAGVRSAHTWDATLGSDANREFLEAYRARTGEGADATALLGYETGLMIAGALEEVGGDVDALGRGLERLAIETPRGRMTIDRSTHEVVPHHYLREVTGRGANRVVEEIAPERRGIEAMMALASERRTGWVGSHLWG